MQQIAAAAVFVTTALIWAGTASAGETYVAHLTGASEVPPVETRAVGNAVVMEGRNGVRHAVNLGNIVDVVAAHIHCAPEGSNGPVGITLFSGGPVGSGQLVRGPLPDPDAGNSCGWATIDDALDAIAAGGAYLNVHTLASLSGEIRGQFR